VRHLLDKKASGFHNHRQNGMVVGGPALLATAGAVAETFGGGSDVRNLPLWPEDSNDDSTTKRRRGAKPGNKNALGIVTQNKRAADSQS
jgi:hypothetical protein